jgi:hypothetical protein
VKNVSPLTFCNVRYKTLKWKLWGLERHLAHYSISVFVLMHVAKGHWYRFSRRSRYGSDAPAPGVPAGTRDTVDHIVDRQWLAQDGRHTGCAGGQEDDRWATRLAICARQNVYTGSPIRASPSSATGVVPSSMSYGAS